jgi:hypothetical protein
MRLNKNINTPLFRMSLIIRSTYLSNKIRSITTEDSL